MPTEIRTPALREAVAAARAAAGKKPGATPRRAARRAQQKARGSLLREAQERDKQTARAIAEADAADRRANTFTGRQKLPAALLVDPPPPHVTPAPVGALQRPDGTTLEAPRRDRRKAARRDRRAT